MGLRVGMLAHSEGRVGMVGQISCCFFYENNYFLKYILSNFFVQLVITFLFHFV